MEIQRQRRPVRTGTVKEAVAQDGETAGARLGGPTRFVEAEGRKECLSDGGKYPQGSAHGSFETSWPPCHACVLFSVGL